MTFSRRRHHRRYRCVLLWRRRRMDWRCRRISMKWSSARFAEFVSRRGRFPTSAAKDGCWWRRNWRCRLHRMDGNHNRSGRRRRIGRSILRSARRFRDVRRGACNRLAARFAEVVVRIGLFSTRCTECHAHLAELWRLAARVSETALRDWQHISLAIGMQSRRIASRFLARRMRNMLD
jgi:hypothetical protein